MHTEAQDRDAVWARELNEWDDERWRSTSELLADRWPLLTIEELKATHGRPELVASVLEAKIGYAQLLARDALSHRQKQKRRSTAHTPSWLQGAGVATALSAGVLILVSL